MTKQDVSSITWSALCGRLKRFVPSSLFVQLESLPPDLLAADQQTREQALQILLKANEVLEPLQNVLTHYAPRYLLDLNPISGQAQGELIEGTFFLLMSLDLRL